MVTGILEWLGSFFWYIEENQLQNAIKKRGKFQLCIRSGGHYCTSYQHSIDISQLKYHEQKVARNFLSWCYFPWPIDDGSMERDWASDLNSADVEFCRDILCEGYSAIGAIIIGRRNKTMKQKRGIINTLMRRGFQPTEDDFTLAKLEIYDALSNIQKTNIVLFLNEESLLIDVKKHIIKMFLDMYRIEFWPLPL